MITPLISPDREPALFVSIVAGLPAILVVVVGGREHDPRNRYCPHARRACDDGALRRRQ